MHANGLYNVMKRSTSTHTQECIKINLIHFLKANKSAARQRIKDKKPLKQCGWSYEIVHCKPKVATNHIFYRTNNKLILHIIPLGHVNSAKQIISNQVENSVVLVRNEVYSILQNLFLAEYNQKLFMFVSLVWLIGCRILQNGLISMGSLSCDKIIIGEIARILLLYYNHSINSFGYKYNFECEDFVFRLAVCKS